MFISAEVLKCAQMSLSKLSKLNNDLLSGSQDDSLLISFDLHILKESMENVFYKKRGPKGHSGLTAEHVTL